MPHAGDAPAPVDVDRDDIDSPWLVGGRAALFEVGICKCAQPGLLAAPNRLFGHARAAATAGAHLNEYQRRAIAHEQIDLAGSAAPLAPDQRVPLPHQMRRSYLLAKIAELFSLVRHV